MSKNPIEKAIKLEIQNQGPGGWLMDYQPGNSTRYLIFFQKVEGPVAKALNLEDSGTLVTFVNLLNSPSVLIPKNAWYLSVTYLMEKTGLSEGDAMVLVRALCRHLGIGPSNDNSQCFRQGNGLSTEDVEEPVRNMFK